MLKRIWALAATRFLTSFNDNAFKAVAMFVTLEIIRIGILKGAGNPDPVPKELIAEINSDRDALVAFGAMVFMLPFVVFPTISGWLSDRFSKRKVLIATKMAELVVMIMGLVSYLLLGTAGFTPLLIAMFLMAMQSTFLSPAYYGILPETFDETEISSANGLIQLVNFLGIILGAACGAAVGLIPTGYYANPTAKISTIICTPFIICALIGIWTAWCVRETNTEHRSEPFGWQLITNYFSDFKVVVITRPIWLCIIGSAFFFSLGSLMMTSLMSFGLNTLGLNPDKTAMLTVAMALGIGFGSFIAGQFSSGRIEFGLVPIGALGMTVFFLHLMATRTFLFALINCAALGFFGGFFVIPLTVYIQDKSPEQLRGKILAQSNAVAFIGMLLVSIVMLVLTGGLVGEAGPDASFFTRVRDSFLTLDTTQLYAGAAVVVVLVCAYAFWVLPDFVIRLVAMLLTKFVYRIRVHGLADLPKKGPVLLLSNHVSYVDALLLSAACPRSVHFFVNRSAFKGGLMRTIAKWAQLIPMPVEGDDASIELAGKQAHQLWQEGEILCIFPEGKLTTNGQMDRFRRDYLKLLPDNMEIPIVPVHLGLLWGSVFSLFYGTIRLRRPQHLPYPVSITFGKPIAKDSSSLAVRNAIANLAADSEEHPGPDQHALPEHFIRLAHRHPLARLFKDTTGKELSCIRFLTQSYALADVLSKQVDDEYIGIMLPNSTTAASLSMGAMLCDRSPVFLNFTASREALNFAVENCKISKIFTSRAFIDKAEIEVRDNFVYLEDLAPTVTGAARLRSFLRALIPAAIARKRYFPKHGNDVHSIATVLFSSGSTGQPKGVLLSHHNLTSNINALIRMLGVDRGEVIVGTLPLFHSFGFLTAFWLPLTWGLRVVWHPSPLDADGIGKLVQEHGGTLLMATPTFLQAYIRKCAPEQFESLRLVITGAEKLSDRVAQKFEEKFGIIPTEGYGTTELSPVVSVNMPENILDTGRKIGRPGSIGQALPGINTRLVDPQTFEDVPEGEEGLLLIKGPNVMKGYLAAPEKTAEVIKDGWYITGDMARLDDAGYIYITGRLSRFSKIGGEMVPHIAIEEEMCQLVNDSERRLAVTAVNDPSRGERLIVLHLPLDEEPKELIRKLRDKGLPNLWIPKPKDFYQVESIPVLGSGKLDLARIRALAEELSGA